VFVLEKHLRVEDGRKWDAQLLGATEEVFPVVLGEVGAQDPFKVLPLYESKPEVLEERVVLELRLLDENCHH
jgi:hypothetical protein